MEQSRGRWIDQPVAVAVRFSVFKPFAVSVGVFIPFPESFGVFKSIPVSILITLSESVGVAESIKKPVIIAFDKSVRFSLGLSQSFGQPLRFSESVRIALPIALIITVC